MSSFTSFELKMRDQTCEKVTAKIEELREVRHNLDTHRTSLTSHLDIRGYRRYVVADVKTKQISAQLAGNR